MAVFVSRNELLDRLLVLAVSMSHPSWMDIFAEQLTTDLIVDQQQTLPPKTVAVARRVPLSLTAYYILASVARLPRRT